MPDAKRDRDADHACRTVFCVRIDKVYHLPPHPGFRVLERLESIQVLYVSFNQLIALCSSVPDKRLCESESCETIPPSPEIRRRKAVPVKPVRL